MRMLRLLVLAFVACVSLHRSVLSQDQVAKPTDESAESIVIHEIDEHNLTHYVEADPSGTREIAKRFGALQNAGPFYGGDILVGSMKIVNRTGGPLTIKEIQSDQSKVKADAPLQTYEDGEGFQLTYRLYVAKNSPHSFANIRLICDGSLKLIKIPMEVQVHNVAAFFLPSYSFSSDAHQPTKLKLRVILTGELQGSDVRVTGTGDLAHLPWKIVRETDQLNISDLAVAELAADEIPPIGIQETVTIECLKSKLTNQTRVQVFYNGAFRIAPNVVHLRSDPVGKSLAGNLVIALTSLRDIGVNRSSDVSVSARLNDTVPCKVDKQVMGDSSLRIRIKVDPQAIKEIPVDAMFVSVDIHGNRVKIPVKVR